MSGEVVANLARRWQCSPEEVGERIAAKLRASGVLPLATTGQAVRVFRGGLEIQRVLKVGWDAATDRFALLDEAGAIVLWLDDDESERPRPTPDA